MRKLMDLKQNGIFLLAALVVSAGAIAADKVYISVRMQVLDATAGEVFEALSHWGIGTRDVLAKS